MENLECRTELQGDTLTAYLHGAIDHHTARQARETVDSDIVDFSPKRLVLDLRDVEFMDSAGLGLILGRYSKMSERGGTVCVREPSDSILRIIKMAGMERYIEIEVAARK